MTHQIICKDPVPTLFFEGTFCKKKQNLKEIICKIIFIHYCFSFGAEWSLLVRVSPVNKTLWAMHSSSFTGEVASSWSSLFLIMRRFTWERPQNSLVVLRSVCQPGVIALHWCSETRPLTVTSCCPLICLSLLLSPSLHPASPPTFSLHFCLFLILFLLLLASTHFCCFHGFISLFLYLSKTMKNYTPERVNCCWGLWSHFVAENKMVLLMGFQLQKCLEHLGLHWLFPQCGIRPEGCTNIFKMFVFHKF